MAIAFDLATSPASVAGVSSVTFSHTCSGSDRALFVGTGGAKNTTDVVLSSITYAAIALTALWDANIGTNTDKRHAARYVVAPATGANNVVVTYSGTMDLLVAGAISLTGVDQTTPIGTPATANGDVVSSNVASVTVTTASGELVIDNLVTTDPVGVTAGANQTSRWEKDNASGWSFGGSTQAGADGPVMSWTLDFGTSTGAVWAIGGVSFKPAGAGGDVLQAQAIF